MKNYIVRLNQKPNKKLFYKGPKQNDKDLTMVSLLMDEHTCISLYKLKRFWKVMASIIGAMKFRSLNMKTLK